MYIRPMSLVTSYTAWMTIESVGYEIMGAAAFDDLFEQAVLLGQVTPVVHILEALVVDVTAVLGNPQQVRLLVEVAIQKIQIILLNASSGWYF